MSMEIIRFKLKIKTKPAWYPVIKREFPEDEKDFGEWYYDD